MDGQERSDLRGLYVEARGAAEILELTKRIEELAAGTSSGYPCMRVRVEAGATLRQTRDLLRAVKELGKRL